MLYRNNKTSMNPISGFRKKHLENTQRNIAEAILTVHGINQYSNNLVAFFGNGHESDNRQAIINWVKKTQRLYQLDISESVNTYIELYRDQINEIMDRYN